MLKNSLFRRLLKKVQMQGGARIPHSAMEMWAFFSSLLEAALGPAALTSGPGLC